MASSESWGNAPLQGRRRECEALERLLTCVHAGQSGVLVLRGEAGVGKTALLDHAGARARGCRVAHVAGVQSEMELAFAGLHQLCGPWLDRIERLPAPQRDALATVFGLSPGAAPDRFLVGLGVLGLLSGVAGEQPIVCLVDDVQWLDDASSQVLAFVARRLLADPIALVIATRQSGDGDEWTGLPELTVGGLPAADAGALLRSVVTGLLDKRVSERIVAETRGIPLALLELPRGLTPVQLAGGFGLPDTSALSSRIEETFERRVASLPEASRRLVLVAAAEPVGDPLLVWRAAERLGIPASAAAPAAAAELLEIGVRVRFRHPLVRSAVYRAASGDDRRAVHRALAEMTDPAVDPDRRAWHRAHAAQGPDEALAEELERLAGRAQARGGFAAAAAFLEQAAALTATDADRTRRTLAAAQAHYRAGAFDAALGLLAAVEVGPLDDLERARAAVIRAQIAFAVDRGRDAPPLLLRAAGQLEALDPAAARETYLDALSAATFTARLSGDAGPVEVARAARSAPAGRGRASDLLLDGLALLLTEGYAAGAATVKRALAAFRGGEVSTDEEIRWLWLAGHAALDVWDDETWHELATRHMERARAAGALSILQIALNTRIGVHLSAGELDSAAALLDEVDAVLDATGGRSTPYIALALAAFQGREAEASALSVRALTEARARGEGIGVTLAHWSAAVLYNGLGRYDQALTAAESAGAHPEDLRFCTRALVEVVEAAAKAGDAERARRAVEELAESTGPGGTELARGTEARARALVSDGEAAERLYREALDRLSRTRVRTALARAHLVYGEWLRGERRRRDAREQLRTAHRMFTTMGMDAFAARAARELVATGETAQRPAARTRGALTAQEAQIARLAAAGLSNAEIGARLYISPRTVQYHLHKVFAKLEISSRSELAAGLGERVHAA